MYMSVNERSRPCSLNLCGPFVRAVLAMKVEVSTRAMAADGTTKVLVYNNICPAPRCVSPPNCTLGSLHDSEHHDVGRFYSLVPRPPPQLLSLAVRKARRIICI